MFVRAGAGVDDRHAAVAAPLQVVHQVGTRLGQPGDRAPHDDHVEVAAEHADRIEPRLALGLAGGGRVADFVAGDAEDLAGGHEREERAGRGLREIEHRPLVVQQIDEEVLPGAALGEHADHVGHFAQLLEQRHVELAGKDHVPQPLGPLKLGHFHPDRTLQTGVVEHQIALVLRLGTFHGRRHGHGRCSGRSREWGATLQLLSHRRACARQVCQSGKPNVRQSATRQRTWNSRIIASSSSAVVHQRPGDVAEEQRQIGIRRAHHGNRCRSASVLCMSSGSENVAANGLSTPSFSTSAGAHRCRGRKSWRRTRPPADRRTAR